MLLETAIQSMANIMIGRPSSRILEQKSLPFYLRIQHKPYVKEYSYTFVTNYTWWPQVSCIRVQILCIGGASCIYTWNYSPLSCFVLAHWDYRSLVLRHRCNMFLVIAAIRYSHAFCKHPLFHLSDEAMVGVVWPQGSSRIWLQSVSHPNTLTADALTYHRLLYEY